MKRSVKMLKICLTALSAISITACNDLPDFPGWNPRLIIPSQNKYFQCKMIDKERFLFECEKTSKEIDASLDSNFCQSPDETKKLINWAKDAREYYDKNCKGNILGNN